MYFLSNGQGNWKLFKSTSYKTIYLSVGNKKGWSGAGCWFGGGIIFKGSILFISVVAPAAEGHSDWLAVGVCIGHSEGMICTAGGEGAGGSEAPVFWCIGHSEGYSEVCSAYRVDPKNSLENIFSTFVTTMAVKTHNFLI